MPDSCPQCGVGKVDLELEADAAYTGYLYFCLSDSPLEERLDLQEDALAPLYVYVYGWYCPHCNDKGDHEFDVVYRLVWDQ